ncbi:MAG: hypothetical protein JXR34_11455 [Bacteroidales bacterium]|nr:hypothetical protein [Bacteroidales bacterium]
MSERIKILFVDDDKRYAEPLVDKAFNEYGLYLDHYEDWEEAKTKLTGPESEYAAIIIDGKGKLAQGSKGDDPKHLNVVLNDLKELKGKGFYIPYVINTAYYEELNTYFGEETMVSKKNQKQLFEIILRLISSSSQEKIKSKYAEAFEAIGEDYLNNEAGDNLLEVLIDFEDNTWTSNSFTPLRKVIESVCKSIHSYDDYLIPLGCLAFENEKVNLFYCELRLTGRDIRQKNSATILYPKVDAVFPAHIGSLFGAIVNVSHKCSHPDYSSYVTKYSLGFVINGLIDLLIWYKKFIDENY